jgi:hypothetical protein
MTARDTAEIGGFLIAVGSIIYQAGKSKQWADGIGKLCRRVNTTQEYRWLMQLAEDVQKADTQDERNMLAQRIREDARRL